MQYALNKCTYVEQYKPEHAYVFTGVCIVTGKAYSVTVPAPGLFAYHQGALMQKAFPNMSAADREFCMSGCSPDGWKELYGEDDSEDDSEG